MFRIEAAFAECEINLWGEFLDTIITDFDLSQKLRYQIWILATYDPGTFSGVELDSERSRPIATLIAQEFGASADANDLKERWTRVVDAFWDALPPSHVKAQAEKLS